MQKAQTKSKIDEMQGVIEEHQQMKTQLAEEQSKVRKLTDDLKKAQKDLEMFEPYREFVTEDIPKVWTIELTNKYAIDGLRRLERKIYGGQIEVLAKEQDELAKPRAYRINRLAEKIIQYVTMTQTNQNIFIRKMIREPGEEV